MDCTAECNNAQCKSIQGYNYNQQIIPIRNRSAFRVTRYTQSHHYKSENTNVKTLADSYRLERIIAH